MAKPNIRAGAGTRPFVAEASGARCCTVPARDVHLGRRIGGLRFVLRVVDEAGESVTALEELLDQAVTVGLQRTVDGPLLWAVEFASFGLFGERAVALASPIGGVVEFLEVLGVLGAVQLTERAGGLSGGGEYLGVGREELVVLLLLRMVAAAAKVSPRTAERSCSLARSRALTMVRCPSKELDPRRNKRRGLKRMVSAACSTVERAWATVSGN